MVANTVKTLRATVNIFQLHVCHQNWELISGTKSSETVLEL